MEEWFDFRLFDWACFFVRLGFVCDSLVVRWGFVWGSFGFCLGVRLGIRLDFDVATSKIRLSSSLVNTFEISFNTLKFVCPSYISYQG